MWADGMESHSFRLAAAWLSLECPNQIELHWLSRSQRPKQGLPLQVHFLIDRREGELREQCAPAAGCRLSPGHRRRSPGIWGSASTSGHAVPRFVWRPHSRTPVPPSALPPETRSRPGRYTFRCRAEGALKHTVDSRLINSPLVSRHGRRSTSFADCEGAERVGSVCVRVANVARRRPPARRETPAWPVVPGDLDTLPARAVAAGDVRAAVLLVGRRDGPSTGEGTNHGSQHGEEP